MAPAASQTRDTVMRPQLSLRQKQLLCHSCHCKGCSVPSCHSGLAALSTCVIQACTTAAPSTLPLSFFHSCSVPSYHSDTLTCTAVDVSVHSLLLGLRISCCFYSCHNEIHMNCYFLALLHVQPFVSSCRSGMRSSCHQGSHVAKVDGRTQACNQHVQ